MDVQAAGSGTGNVEVVGSAVRIPIAFRYADDQSRNAASIGTALIALNDVVMRSTRVFHDLAGSRPPKHAKCHLDVDELRRGSILETFLFHVLCESPAQAHQYVSSLVSRIAENNSALVPYVVGAALGGVLTAAGIYALRKFAKGKDAQPMIEAHNSIVFAAGKNLNVDGAVLERLFQKEAEKVGIARSAVAALRPGGNVGDVRIETAGGAAIVIPRAASENLPDPDSMEDGSGTRTIPLEGVSLRIVASDAEHLRNGWAAYLPDDHPMGGMRLRLLFPKDIDPRRAMYREHVTCTGDLVAVVDQSTDSITPKHILVRRIDDPS